MAIKITQKDLNDIKRGLKKELRKEIKAKNQAYYERNQLVSALSKLFPSCLGEHTPIDKNWEKDWRTIVFITLPTGQASWHIHKDDIKYFSHLSFVYPPWDGHTTEEKYERLANI